MNRKHRVTMGVVCALTFCGSAGEAAMYAGWAVGAVRDGQTSGTILRSVDSGSTWTYQGVGQIAQVTMWGVHAVDANTAWVVGDSDGYATIYRTIDGGATWQRKGAGNPLLKDLSLGKVDAVDANHVWAVGQGAILHSSDGGNTWANVCPPEYSTNVLQGVSTPSDQVIWASGKTQTDPATGTSYALILKSTDGGATWDRQTDDGTSNLLADWDHMNGISGVDAITAYAEGGGHGGNGGHGVVWTHDGGSTWSEHAYAGLRDGNEASAVDAQTVWTVSDSSIHRTTDGGAHWETVANTPEYTLGISALSDTQAWACSFGFRGEIHATQNGADWTSTTQVDGEPLPGLWTISFASDAVPEPGSVLLFAMGALALGALSRREAGARFRTPPPIDSRCIRHPA